MAKAQAITAVVINRENLERWSKKEAGLYANFVMEEIKSSVPPEKWSDAVDAACEGLKQIPILS